MRFVREIPTNKLPSDLFNLEQEGFVLVWKEDSVELWFPIH